MDSAGRVVVAPRYHVIDQFSVFGLAMVLDDSGWAVLDVQGRLLLRPFIFNNGPDGFREGLARFVEGGKIGFFNQRGRKVIPAQFDFAWPFHNGIAVICQRGIPKRIDDERKIIVGGQWASINRSGRLVTPFARYK